MPSGLKNVYFYFKKNYKQSLEIIIEFNPLNYGFKFFILVERINNKIFARQKTWR